MHCIILRTGMTLQLFLGSSLSSVPVKKKTERSSSTNCICHQFLPLVAVIFHFPFPDFLFFFFSPGRDILWTTSPTSLCRQIYQKHFHYNVYNNRNHVHSHHIYSQFQEGTMMTKGNLFMSLKGNFRCQFVYTLHGVLAKIILRSCVTRDGAISKMRHLSILMEPTLLLEKASATVSYNAFG